jgi:hypothetical protein
MPLSTCCCCCCCCCCLLLRSAFRQAGPGQGRHLHGPLGGDHRGAAGEPKAGRAGLGQGYQPAPRPCSGRSCSSCSCLWDLPGCTAGAGQPGSCRQAGAWQLQLLPVACVRSGGQEAARQQPPGWRHSLSSSISGSSSSSSSSSSGSAPPCICPISSGPLDPRQPCQPPGVAGVQGSKAAHAPERVPPAGAAGQRDASGAGQRVCCRCRPAAGREAAVPAGHLRAPAGQHGQPGPQRRGL